MLTMMSMKKTAARMEHEKTEDVEEDAEEEAP